MELQRPWAGLSNPSWAELHCRVHRCRCHPGDRSQPINIIGTHWQFVSISIAPQTIEQLVPQRRQLLSVTAVPASFCILCFYISLLCIVDAAAEYRGVPEALVTVVLLVRKIDIPWTPLG